MNAANGNMFRYEVWQVPQYGGEEMFHASAPTFLEALELAKGLT